MGFAARWEQGRAWVIGEPAGDLAVWAAEQEALADTVIFATSGSAGRPKQVVLTKEGLALSARTVNEWLGVERSSVWGLVLPDWHVGGFGVKLRAHLAGCRGAVWPGKWEAAAVAGWLASERVTHLSLVPTQVHDLVAGGLRAPAGLRAVVVGGGRMPEETGQAARDLGWPVLASYGLTEAGSQVATAGLDELWRPYRAAPLRVLSHWQVCVGEGERLWLRGGALLAGWVEGDDGDAWRWQAREGEWFATSDRADVTSDGWLTPLGRLDAQVKVLGELVDPLAIEERLEEIGGVALAGHGVVVAVPDRRAGQRLVWVVEERSVPVDQVARVLAAYHREAKGFARVAGPVWVAVLPRSPLGKPLRAEIATKMAAGAFRD